MKSQKKHFGPCNYRKVSSEIYQATSCDLKDGLLRLTTYSCKAEKNKTVNEAATTSHLCRKLIYKTYENNNHSPQRCALSQTWKPSC